MQLVKLTGQDAQSGRRRSHCDSGVAVVKTSSALRYSQSLLLSDTGVLCAARLLYARCLLEVSRCQHPPDSRTSKLRFTRRYARIDAGGNDGGFDIEVEWLIVYTDSPVVNSARGWNGVCTVVSQISTVGLRYCTRSLHLLFRRLLPSHFELELLQQRKEGN